MSDYQDSLGVDQAEFERPPTKPVKKRPRRNHHAVLLFVPSQSRMWLCCNACGYDFRRKANGEADGKDVIEHKRLCRPDFRAIK